jgi:hypothetical protein
VVVAHHANLLGLLEHVVYPLRVAVQHDVRLGRVLDLLQQRPAENFAVILSNKNATNTVHLLASLCNGYIVFLCCRNLIF